MKQTFKTGLFFGITSGIITTLGLMVGLEAGTNSVLAVIGGVLTIAIADAFSDSLGIHVSQESEKKNTSKQVWESTFSTFLTKFFVAITFVIPVLIFDLPTAILSSVIWGLTLLGIVSYFIAKAKNEKPWEVVTQHVGIALVVVVITHLFGDFIALFFV
jgi:VIT1/CCC1 family predicted Fe2+/Mn2+ transporter